MSTEPLLRVEDLVKHYPIRRGIVAREVGAVRAVDGVSFEVGRGETLGLVGESGCGKTTVGRALLRLIEPTSGAVYYRRHADGPEVELCALDARRLRELRRELQIVFQDPNASLNPRMTVGAMLAEALSVHGLARGVELQERTRSLLERVGLDASAARRFPHEFSGGQRQRIGIARALAVEPRFLVCDEAVSALDVSIQAQIVNLLAELRDELELSYLFIAHDLSLVRHLCDRVAVMYLGRIVEVGPTEAIFASPAHPYTQALLAAVPRVEPGSGPRERLVLGGDVPSPADPPAGCHFHPRCAVAEARCRETYPETMPLKVGGEDRRAACHLI